MQQSTARADWLQLFRWHRTDHVLNDDKNNKLLIFLCWFTGAFPCQPAILFVVPLKERVTTECVIAACSRRTKHYSYTLSRRVKLGSCAPLVRSIKTLELEYRV